MTEAKPNGAQQITGRTHRAQERCINAAGYSFSGMAAAVGLAVAMPLSPQDQGRLVRLLVRPWVSPRRPHVHRTWMEHV